MLDLYEMTKEEVEKEIEKVNKELAELPTNMVGSTLIKKKMMLIQFRAYMDTNLYDLEKERHS